MVNPIFDSYFHTFFIEYLFFQKYYIKEVLEQIELLKNEVFHSQTIILQINLPVILFLREYWTQYVPHNLLTFNTDTDT